MVPRAALLAVVLVITLFAGCATDDAPDVDVPADKTEDQRPDPGLIVGKRDLRFDLEATDSLPAPVWQVGDHFGLHVFFGSGDTEGNHFETIVIESGPDGYTLATDSRQVAKEHAVVDLPILGSVGTDLALTGLGGAWDLYEFPLTDGKVWQGEIPNIAFDVIDSDTVPLTLTATYTADIETRDGKLPGFHVVGTTADGTKIVEYDYAPAIGWFASLVVYDIDPEQDPIEFTAVSMGHGAGWTGTVYVDEATVVLQNRDGSGLDDPPPQGKPFVAVSPYTTFTVPDAADYLFGLRFDAAVFGARATFLVTPSGEVRETSAVGAPERFGTIMVDEVAEPGEWRLLTTGAGGMSMSLVLLYAVTETAIEL
ncbi:MAG: hypothetical protein KY455_02880 [Euryarchaeota archaeon]|nr:hypothetical protein [Euryarchaeota archaeon]